MILQAPPEQCAWEVESKPASCLRSNALFVIFLFLVPLLFELLSCRLSDVHIICFGSEAVQLLALCHPNADQHVVCPLYGKPRTRTFH